ncbi:uncharacterized protein LOC143220171 [Lasioglossum baleicum]|uniref:uncharacterized protein LOC143220171 n=1 Tax=Lasioglossum baleicum TaxID=434251 RepID=UPI003FCE6514
MEFSVEELLSKQSEIGRKISRITENFRKTISQAKMTGGDVKSRLQRLEEYWSLFQKNHDILAFRHMDAIKGSDYVKMEYADAVEEAYMEQRGRLLDLANQFGEGGSSTTKRSAAASSKEEKDPGSAPLPRMQLPEFAGAYVEWPSFKDLFKSIVERNKSLGAVDRLQYLKSSLHGEAADLIRDLPTTGENYDRAWAILREQYENKRILVRSCLDKLASLPAMRESSAQEIINVQKGVLSVINTLEGLGRPITKTEDWFVYSVVKLLDPVTRDKWEERIAGSTDPPSFSSLKEFLIKRRQQLEASTKLSSSPPAHSSNSSNQLNHHEARSNQGSSKPKGPTRTVRSNHANQSQRPACIMCNEKHYLMQCPKYKALPPAERRGQVEKIRLCCNCLGRHQVATCPSTRSCLTCGERHHSTLHDAYRDGSRQTTTAHHIQDCRNVEGKILLATAIILVADRHGRQQEVRALVDQGSEISMVTEGLAQRLQLARATSTVDIYGVGGQRLAKARGRVNLDVSSFTNDETIKVSAIVLPKLTSYNLGCSTPNRPWNHLKGLKLADPAPATVTPIEVLLGADVYTAIIREGIRKGAPNEPVGQQTIFGWIVTGRAGVTTTTTHARVHQVLVGDSLSTVVRRFWEQEELRDPHATRTAEEMECENFFASSHSRTPEGRYQVRLPFKSRGPITSGSRTASWHSLKRMEQKFKRDEAFKSLYSDFISQYEELGHMTLVNPPSTEQPAHYLPHHGVLKPSSTTTKLRVVFNGSWSEASQQSLNDCLHAGPNLLPLLADVLLRWRKHKYVVTADIIKMYRQILVHPEDRNFQRILWRDNESEEVREYCLNTVTYGLSCAPFLAVRTLHQLAEDEGSQYPIAARALRHDSYVDDILTGADTIHALKETALQLQQLCKAGGFILQKWASNTAELRKVTIQLSQSQPSSPLDGQPESKTWTDSIHPALGLLWSPHDDSFRFTITDTDAQPTTKRSVVSKAAQLFDPLGWLTPVIVRAKITIQSTWLLGIGWDDPLPAALDNDWRTFCAELKQLEMVRLPRPLFQNFRNEQREFHGFADASERAYGAVVYLRMKTEDNRWTLTLVAAKSKVAPLQQVSLPRLELCAAHLLARLTQHITTTLHMDKTEVHLWSDSTVALGWIQGHPSRWRTYVANRVADIQRRVPEAQWHHIAGVKNPADCASRGLSPSQLLSWTLWWKGPEFLHCDANLASSAPVAQENLPEQREPIVAVVTGAAKEEEENETLQRFSSYTRLLRVTAWCRRWLSRFRDRPSHTLTNTDSFPSGQPTDLTTAELINAERGWIHAVQRMAFGKEVSMLTQNQSLSQKSNLAPLVPSLDKHNLMRVGGRLGKAPLNPDETHPIILPPQSHLTQLIVDFIHRSTMHGGVQATLGAIRQRFWIPTGRSIVKKAIRKCVTCLRWRAEPAQQLMADLPTHRVTPARPFHSTGVDYAGPIWLRTTSGRGHKAYKGFFAVFVCMVTKAVHLEVVSDYTSEAFLAAFRRFVSRRGICAHLYSDCGTNFIGADRELRRLFTANSQENRSLRDQMSTLRTEWHFNPPAAPHFGGLWEAAVKSTKYHLRRTIGETKLTFEEMTTLLAQVEACLNSRPLAALSDDPADLTALTPGHFLVGSALQALPEPSLLDEGTNRLTRWQLISKMRDQFWARWKREYLHALTSRTKWRQTKENISPGRLCIIVGEQTPPSRWLLARVTEAHPGTDGKVRVVKVATAISEFTRPIHKLVVLPIDTNDR